MTDNKVTGYLELFIGPMFSGKTSKLLEIYKQYTYCNIGVTVINHSSDTRYHDSMLSTHDKVMIPCIQTDTLFSVVDSLKRDDGLQKWIDVILINEGQFFADLYPFVLQMLKENKKVYIAGLDGDFERNKFGSLLDLIPHCDKVTKLTSFCSICRDGTLAIFSLRLTAEKDQMLIGSDNYTPVCRYCYTKLSS
jgi:thymidine kinase